MSILTFESCQDLGGNVGRSEGIGAGVLGRIPRNLEEFTRHGPVLFCFWFYPIRMENREFNEERTSVFLVI